MRQSSFPLRLASSLQEACKTAESEGVSLNQLINLAVAEKISALRTEEFFRERGARAIAWCRGKYIANSTLVICAVNSICLTILLTASRL